MTSPSTPATNPSKSVSLSVSAPLPASTATANSNTVPGTISPAIARHSTKATMNTAAASHCGLTASHPVTLSSHGPIKTTPSNVQLLPGDKCNVEYATDPCGSGLARE